MIGLVFEMFGPVAFVVLVLIVLAFILWFFFRDTSAKSHSEESERVEKIKEYVPPKARVLTYDEATIELNKVLSRHPDAVGDIRYVANKTVYRVYWLAIGKENSANELDVHFAISEDLFGMKVLFTNRCSHAIEIEWPSFRIDKSRVYINGVNYLSYTDRTIESGETVVKLLQPVKLKEGDRFKNMFDYHRINKEELVYHVAFTAKVMGAKHKYAYDVHTKMKLIYKS